MRGREIYETAKPPQGLHKSLAPPGSRPLESQLDLKAREPRTVNFPITRGGKGLGLGEQVNPKKRWCREKGNREGSVKETGRNTLSISKCLQSREAAQKTSMWPWVQCWGSATS